MIEKLKIILVDKIITFESPSDERAAKLAIDISRYGKLKNPLLVYPLGEKYLLLDDASILRALTFLGVSHIPVQIADEDKLSVHPWQRVVENWSRKDLREFCSRFPKQIRLEKSSSGILSPDQAEVRFRDGSAQRLTFPSSSYLVRMDICSRLFDHLIRNHKCFRAKLDYTDRNVFAGLSSASAVVFPPAFSLVELAAVALRQIRLPQGMVRIGQPNRVLGIDYSLSILTDDVSAREKELFLRQLLLMRMSSDRVAYYNGGVYMFNN